LSATKRLFQKDLVLITKDQGTAYPDGGCWTSSLSPVPNPWICNVQDDSAEPG